MPPPNFFGRGASRRHRGLVSKGPSYGCRVNTTGFLKTTHQTAISTSPFVFEHYHATARLPKPSYNSFNPRNPTLSIPTNIRHTSRNLRPRLPTAPLDQYHDRHNSLSTG